MKGKEAFLSAAMIGIITLSSCSGGVNQPSSPGIEQPVSKEWNSLSAAQRVDRLELKQISKNLDVNTETVRALCELFSEQMPTKFTNKEMQSKISFVDLETFVNENKKQLGRSDITDNERIQIENRAEIVIGVGDSSRILINPTKISSIANGIKAKSSQQQLKMLGNYDLEAIAKHSVIVHSLAHLNSSTNNYKFPSDFLVLIDDNAFVLKEIDSLDLRSIHLNSNSRVTTAGVTEAMTEIIASMVKRPSELIVFSDTYSPARRTVAELNALAGVSNQELKDYCFGTKSIDGLLKKWGSIKNPNKPDPMVGASIYFLASLMIDPAYNQESIRTNIEEKIGKKLSNLRLLVPEIGKTFIG